MLKEREDLLLERLIAESVTNGMAPIEADGYRLTVSKKIEPFVSDWPSLLAHIRSTGEVDLLEKRLLKSAAKARWEDGHVVPGILQESKFATVLKDIR